MSRCPMAMAFGLNWYLEYYGRCNVSINGRQLNLPSPNVPHSNKPDDRIDAKLRAVAEALAAPPPWYDAWSRLTYSASNHCTLPLARP